MAGIVLLGLALFVALSVLSLELGSGTLMGPCGASVGLGVYALFGIGAYLFAVALAFAALRCLSGQPVRVRSLEGLAALGAALFSSVLLHMALGGHRLRGYSPGGLLGEYAAEVTISLVGRVGTLLVAVVGLAASLVLCTPLSIRAAALRLAEGARLLASGLTSLLPALPKRSRSSEPEPERKREPERERAVRPKRGRHSDDTLEEGAAEESAPAAIADAEPTEASMLPADELPLATPAMPTPKIVEPLAAKKRELLAAPAEPKPDYIPAAGGYHLPEVGLLDYEEPTDAELDKSTMLDLADKLQKTLADYHVRGQVTQIHPGPVVTMYEFVPAAGTKLARIVNLENDLAMALAALRVRIVAPIPGKSSVGIEVPNKRRATVFLKEILADEEVQKSKPKLTFGLGKDIAGVPVAVDLAKMPHLLVAGTTGSGKSVAVNGMICSILFNATPEEVRMIMIDPKMVELSIYEGIPHLLLPVVTDPKKANLALRWAVDEMERRYELVSKASVRDILSYNKKVEKILADGPPKIEPPQIKIYVADESGRKREVEVPPEESAVTAAGGEVTSEVRDEISAAHAAAHKKRADAPPPPRKLPYIIIIIDEFADLMMVASKEVETSVARIAQKARAVGIHLLVATQRPSADVITGLIKANFPSRIAFQVASKLDSRIMLDQQGAENLLGMGDMLFQDRGQALRRIHGALVTDVEIKRLVEFLKEQGQPVYDMDILKPRADEEGEGEGGFGDAARDEMYDQAVRLVCETRNASVSMIQRRLQVGFNRASRMVEMMEREGIVGPANGAKPREVLAQAI